MSKVFFKLSTGNFFQDWSDTSLLSVTDNWDNVPSIVGYRGDGLTGSTGVNPSGVLGDGTPVVDVNVNQTNPNTNSTGGVTEFQIADPVVALQGSGTARAPSLVLYLDATGRDNLHFAVDLRDIDGGGDNSIQQVAVQYRLGDSGAWTNLPAGYVADASTGPNLATNVTHLDFDLPSALANQSQVELRVITTDAVGADEWIGIDNIAVTSTAMAADTTPPIITGSTPADDSFGVAKGANIVLNFSEVVALGSGQITITDGAADTRVIDVTDASQVSISGQSLIINPSANLNLGTDYHVSVDAGAVVDLAGNAFAGTSATIDFRTIDPLTPIYTIQGAGHTSAYDGKLVNTHGVVTAIDTSGTKGFYIQDASGDGNDATSDAIFVFSSTGATQVQVGDMVEVTAYVDEYQGNNTNNLTITELTGVQDLQIVSSGNSVAPTVLGAGGRLIPTEVVDSDNFAVFNPDHDAIDFYESIEGMLVTAKDVVALSTTYQNATFVVTDNGATASGFNDRGAVTNSETDKNPERFELYADTGVNPNMTATYVPGDKIGDVSGIMTYFGGHWELIPTTTPNAAVSTTIARDQSALHGDASHLTVGAYNLENCDPNDPAAKFDAIGHDIAVNLNAPDIMGVEEIQDSNGTGKGVLDCTVTMQKVVDAIAAAGGPHYQWIVIDPTAENTTGGEPNGNIRTVIMYNPERVSYVDGSAKLLEDNTPANGDSFHNSRKPLVADFTFHGETVTYVGIHNYSRLGSDALFGLDQPAINSGDARRVDQTSTVRDYVQSLVDANPDANVVVAGDFNAYHHERSLTLLEDNGLMHNLVWTLAPTDRYSSAFEGENQQIDNMLVSSKLAGGALFDNVHLNSNQPYGTTPSDHDPILSQLLVNTAPVAAGDTLAATEDVTLAVDAAHGLLSNDTDQNGDALSAQLVTDVAHGTLTLHADGSFEYTGDANYNGADSFSYVAKDGYGGESAVVTVALDVAAVNDAPVAQGEAAMVAEDAAVSIDVLANDSDVDGDALSIVLAGAKSALGASISVENGQVRYVADADSFDLLAAGHSAADSFTYQVSDGQGGLSAPVTVAVTVTEAGDNGVAYGSNKSDVFTDAAGHDTTYSGGNGDDQISGGDGADVLAGDNGNDHLNGGDGIDVLFGGNGTDVLFGGAGDDRLAGDNGSDILAGGVGKDMLTGGLGADTFVVSVGGNATITDFRGEDSIVTGYTGNGADLQAFVKAAHVAGSFVFADVDNAVVITGASLGDGSITLVGWTAAGLQSLHGAWLV